jgi:hypothetical protein
MAKLSTLPLIATLLALPAPAHAQQAAADALFDSARTAMAKGDFAAACEQFRASDQLDPALGTELNLADCEEKRGHVASAWELYRTAQEKLGEKDERVALARSRAQALEPRIPKLTLTLASGAPKDSTVREGQVDLGSGTFGVALPVDPGAHVLVISAPGFQPRTVQISLKEGEARTLSVGPGAPLAAAPVNARSLATQPLAAQAPAPRVHPSGRTLGFTLGGVGVAGLGVGAIAGLLEIGKKHTVDADCQADKSCTSAGLDAAHSARTLEIVSNVGWVVGAAALSAGVYFLLSSGASEKPSTAVSLSTDTTSGRLSLSRSF